MYYNDNPRLRTKFGSLAQIYDDSDVTIDITIHDSRVETTVTNDETRETSLISARTFILPRSVSCGESVMRTKDNRRKQIQKQVNCGTLNSHRYFVARLSFLSSIETMLSNNPRFLYEKNHFLQMIQVQYSDLEAISSLLRWIVYFHASFSFSV